MKHWKSISINKIYYSWEYTLSLWNKPQIRIWHTDKGTDGGYMLIPKSFFEKFILHNDEGLFRQRPNLI